MIVPLMLCVSFVHSFADLVNAALAFGITGPELLLLFRAFVAERGLGLRGAAALDAAFWREQMTELLAWSPFSSPAVRLAIAAGDDDTYLKHHADICEPPVRFAVRDLQLPEPFSVSAGGVTCAGHLVATWLPDGSLLVAPRWADALARLLHFVSLFRYLNPESFKHQPRQLQHQHVHRRPKVRGGRAAARGP